jgi:hypothetical protein
VLFQTDGNGAIEFSESTLQAIDEGNVEFYKAKFQTKSESELIFRGAVLWGKDDGRVDFSEVSFQSDEEGSLGFNDVSLTNTRFNYVDFASLDFGGADMDGIDLREADISGISVDGTTNCERLNEEHRRNKQAWDATARSYHQLKKVFSEHGLVAKARNLHVQERRARSFEVKAANGWTDSQYIRSFVSRVFTGYGVEVRNITVWMCLLFVFSTLWYTTTGVEDTIADNVSYSVLAFTVAPPSIPSGIATKIVMMVETFFGTLSIVLLGYVLGNRERF